MPIGHRHVHKLEGEIMNTKALAELVGLPTKAVKYILENHIVKLPLQEDDLHFLLKYSEIWGKRELIRLQLAPLGQSERAAMLFGAGHDKIERWIINRLLGHYANEDGTYLRLGQVVDEVMTHFEIPAKMSNKYMAIARKMRKKVCNARYRNDNLVEISKRLNGYKQVQTRKVKQKQSTSAEASRNLLGL